jgi:hypothetical protein
MYLLRSVTNFQTRYYALEAWFRQTYLSPDPKVYSAVRQQNIQTATVLVLRLPYLQTLGVKTTKTHLMKVFYVGTSPQLRTDSQPHRLPFRGSRSLPQSIVAVEPISSFYRAYNIYSPTHRRLI